MPITATTAEIVAVEKDTCDSATASSNIRKTQDPAGNTGSDVGTHDDTDRLLQLHIPEFTKPMTRTVVADDD